MIEFRLLNRCHAEEARAGAPRPGAGFGAPRGPRRCASPRCVSLLRYWHSTATYTIATEVSGGPQHLPPARHPVYQWPRDLLKPDLVLLLSLGPEERARRLQGRGLERTQEEAELEANSVFRQK